MNDRIQYAVGFIRWVSWAASLHRAELLYGWGNLQFTLSFPHCCGAKNDAVNLLVDLPCVVFLVPSRVGPPGNCSAWCSSLTAPWWSPDFPTDFPKQTFLEVVWATYLLFLGDNKLSSFIQRSHCLWISLMLKSDGWRKILSVDSSDLEGSKWIGSVLIGEILTENASL